VLGRQQQRDGGDGGGKYSKRTFSPASLPPPQPQQQVATPPVVGAASSPHTSLEQMLELVSLMVSVAVFAADEEALDFVLAATSQVCGVMEQHQRWGRKRGHALASVALEALEVSFERASVSSGEESASGGGLGGGVESSGAASSKKEERAQHIWDLVMGTFGKTNPLALVKYLIKGRGVPTAAQPPPQQQHILNQQQAAQPLEAFVTAATLYKLCGIPAM